MSAMMKVSMVALTIILTLIVASITTVVAQAGYEASFLHGVASGDPVSDAIVIWTRATPRMSVDSLSVSWQVRTYGGDEVIDSGTVQTNGDRDWTVKVDVQSPRFRYGLRYEYQFSVGIQDSPVGLFSLPAPRGTPQEQLRYAVFSCSNWGWGYFNAYEEAARQAGSDGSGLDFWMHLGDYYYEYGPSYPYSIQSVRYMGLRPVGNNVSTVSGEDTLRPAHETLSLQDYRQRHALYRTDRSLQKLSSRAPLISVWDDHEIANDPWMNGAQNHQPDEGDWFEREKVAIRAYHEWLPTRTGAYGSNTYIGTKIYRKFEFGDLASLMMLETRLLGRTAQNDIGASITFLDADAYFVNRSVHDIIGKTVPPEQWSVVETESTDESYKGMTIEEALMKLRDDADAFAARSEKELFGSEQLQWIKSTTDSSSRDGMTWQLYGQQIVMMEHRQGNVTAAFESDDFSGSEYDTWRRQWKSLLDPTNRSLKRDSEDTIMTNDSGEPYQKAQRGIERKATSYDKMYARFSYAVGYYGILDYYDDWMGYIAERQRFYDSITSAYNPIVYAGDYHNAWAGTHIAKDDTIVLNEFGGTSVTSPGMESRNSILPHEVMARAFESSTANQVTYANTHERGFLLIDLEDTVHTTKYVYVAVDSDGSRGEFYSSRCEAAFEVPAGKNPADRTSMKRIDCEYIPSGTIEGNSPALRGNAVIVASNEESSSKSGGLSAGGAVALVSVFSIASALVTFYLMRRCRPSKGRYLHTEMSTRV